MIYAEFFHNAGDKHPACGDRAVLRLDARENSRRHHEHAKSWACKHRYAAYRLICGERLLTATPISKIYII